MKKTKIIIPAIGMLLLSTAASISGTVAWFSMNASVTATGMSVSARSDSFFLEIAGSVDAGVYSTTGTNALTGSLYPAAHETGWDALADVTDFTNNWYYQYSDSPANASTGLTGKTYLTAFTGYVATCTYSVKLNSNSGQTEAYNLYVSALTIPAAKGIHVIVAGLTGYKELSTSADPIAYAAADVLSTTVTTEAQTISVYIYFDGNDANVYSNNVAQLTGAVSFKLAVHSTAA